MASLVVFILLLLVAFSQTVAHGYVVNTLQTIFTNKNYKDSTKTERISILSNNKFECKKVLVSSINGDGILVGQSAPEMHGLTPLAWKGMMLLLCVIWATNFAVIKKIFQVIPPDTLSPSLYLAIRFSISALVMAPGAFGSFKNTKLLRNGLLVGLCKIVAYVGQTMGLLTSTANKTAFFCSLNVVWVALVNGIRSGVFPISTWLGIVFSVLGAAVIESNGYTLKPDINDLWLLLQPIGFGTSYIVLEENMKKFPNSSKAITSIKLITIAVFAIAWAAYNGHTLRDLEPILKSPVATAGIMYVSLITTAFGIYLSSIVLKRVSSTDAALILTLEPIWATAFAVALIGEVVSMQDYIGCSLIILGCIVNELPFLDTRELLRKMKRLAHMKQLQEQTTTSE